MKWLKPICLCSFFLLILAGCGTAGLNSAATGGKSVENLTFKQVKISQLPKSIQSKAKEVESSPQPVQYATFADGQNYILISLGERQTGGYQVKVTKLVKQDQQVTVYAEEVPPPKNGLVTQAITHPYTIVAVESDQAFENVQFELKLADADSK